MTSNILARIVYHKHVEVANARTIIPLTQLEDEIKKLPPTKDFKAALSGDTVALIAEIKFKSPSKGVIAPESSLTATVASYRDAGCEAISVLTDTAFFGGSGEYLKETRGLTEQPLLRKDFIIDAYQIYEARVLGADAVLLIAGVLTFDTLKEFLQLAEELGLTPLVECRSLREIELAIFAGATVIGINNRDLTTFKVDLETTFKIVEEIKDENIIIVSESGIHHRSQVERLADCGVNAILVGEALMSAPDPVEAARSLRGVPVGREPGC